MSEFRPLKGGTASLIVNDKNLALNHFKSIQRLRELPEFALPEDELCTTQLFQIFIKETANTCIEKKTINERHVYTIRLWPEEFGI